MLNNSSNITWLLLGKKSFPPDIAGMIRKKPAAFWEIESARQSLALFRKAARQVPAYRDFLKQNHIKPSTIRTLKDLLGVPPIGKKNYFKKYSLQDVSVQGNLAGPMVYTSTSGSTGDPFYFHRSFNVSWQTSVIHELFHANGNYGNEPVLVVVCFSMGIWIGGLITYQAFHFMQEKGSNISIVTPGINKEEIFKILKTVAPLYKHVILAGYPPFIKDIIDESAAHGIAFKKGQFRFIFAAESFTENFRQHIASQAKVKNPLIDTMNIYGTAELGAMAFETPLTILIRRLGAQNPALFEAIFKKIHKVPTLCQYIPSFISFEADSENLLITGDNTMPLVRYALGDHGGVYRFSDMIGILGRHGLDLHKETKKAHIEDWWCELPFVYVYEREDFSTNIYGLQVYPGPIREALLKKPLSTYLTGKFTLETRFDSKQNQYLLIHLEMKKNNNGGPPPVIRRAMVNAIVQELELKNSEYRELHKFIGSRALPRLQFWPAEDPKYFKLGIKQKWVKK